MKKITLISAIVLLASSFCVSAQTSDSFVNSARIQFIHNSADAALPAVDIYANGILIANNLPYRSATRYMEMPSDVAVRIDIAPDSSTSADAAIYSIDATFSAGNQSIGILHGAVSQTGYPSLEPLQFSVFSEAREVANLDNMTDVLMLNTLLDVPQINIVMPARPGEQINADVFYRPTATGYYELAPSHYEIKVTSLDNTLSTSYRMPLGSMRLHGKAVTVIPSGFLYPSLNQNGPEFAVLLALPNGGQLIPLEMVANNVYSFAEANILMHPNPAVDFLNFEFPFSTRIINARIIDIMGREVRSHQNISTKLDVSDLQNGVYTLNLEIDDKNYTEKFVKGL